MKNLVFLGDSLTAGYGLSPSARESVPSLIQNKIAEEGLDYAVCNAGLSGSTSGNGLYRLDFWLKRPVDAFVLQLGINDLLTGVPVMRMRKNLENIIEKVLARNPGCKIALMGMRLPVNSVSPVADDFNRSFPLLAGKYDLAYVPFYLEGVAGQAGLNLPDGFHPNAQGYQVIAEKIWPVLRAMLVA